MTHRPARSPIESFARAGNNKETRDASNDPVTLRDWLVRLVARYTSSPFNSLCPADATGLAIVVRSQPILCRSFVFRFLTKSDGTPGIRAFRATRKCTRCRTVRMFALSTWNLVEPVFLPILSRSPKQRAARVYLLLRWPSSRPRTILNVNSLVSIFFFFYLLQQEGGGSIFYIFCYISVIF